MDLSNKTVLVTGADGFIGSHLVEALVQRHCRVRALAYYNSFNTWGWLDALPEETMRHVEVVTGDIRDPYGTRKLAEGAEIIFHLAALISIPFSYHSPDMYIDTNVKGTLNVLNAARDVGCSRLIVTSTSEVYGTARYVPMDENHPLQGQSPYSASKIGADRLAESFYRSFDLPLIIVRPFNTYGPRQSARAVIPAIIGQLLAGDRPLVLGKVSPTRDLVFVKDTAEGFIAAAQCDAAVGEEVNIATEKEISIEKVAEKLTKIFGVDVGIVLDEQRLRPGRSEVERLLGSKQKLKNLTGWEPRWSLDDGLAETVEWFRQNLRHYKTNLYNI